MQGATEFLPISSSAHLKVVPMALGWGDPGVAFTAIIQLGSILAVIWYFWQDLKNLTMGMIKAWRTKNYDTHEFKIGTGIIVGTIPICVVGLAIKAFVDDFDGSAVRGLSAIALASIIMSILLAMAEKFCHPKRTFDDLSIKDGILMGLAETLALIPGVSRSGSTITAGLFINLERSTAARFSFFTRYSSHYHRWFSGIKRCFSPKFDQRIHYALSCRHYFFRHLFLSCHCLVNSLFTKTENLDFCLVSSRIWFNYPRSNLFLINLHCPFPIPHCPENA